LPGKRIREKFSGRTVFCQKKIREKNFGRNIFGIFRFQSKKFWAGQLSTGIFLGFSNFKP